MTTDASCLFDTHVHLDAAPLCRQLDEELRLARRQRVAHFLVPGVDPGGWFGLLATVRSIPGAFAAPGVHPLAAASWDESVAARLSELLHRPEVVAVGEVGLDALLAAPAAPVQEAALRAQLRLAVDAGKPLLLHCRKATGHLLEILRQEGARRVGGIWHAFSGSEETARAAIELGFALGIGGPVTYPNARRLLQVVQKVPASWLVLETDAPDLAPHPHRGSANRPAYLALIASRVAELRGWDLQETGRITTANARRVLRLPGGSFVQAPPAAPE